MIYFSADLNPREELWEGKRIPPEIAVDYYGMDNAYCISNLRKYLDSYVKDKQSSSFGSKNVTIWYDFNGKENLKIHELMTSIKKHIDSNLREWNFLSPK